MATRPMLTNLQAGAVLLFLISLLFLLFLYTIELHEPQELLEAARKPLTPSWEPFLQNLRSKLLEDLRPHFTPGNKVALMHVPFGGCNCGDYALGVGTLLAFHELGQELVYTSTGKNAFSPEKMRAALGKDGVITVFPGGNFGDLWGFDTIYRDLIKAMHDYPIIFLPNTISFSTAEKVRLFRQAMEAHGRVTVFMRELPSFTKFKELFPNTPCFLTPDMALMYGPIHRRRSEYDLVTKPSSPILFLKRTDKESNFKIDISLNHDVVQVVDFVKKENCEALSHVKKAQEPALQYLEATANLGFSILSRGKVVVTDRLHGHIMSMLQGIPHIVLNNNYHKISGMLSTWTGNSSITYTATSVVEALDIAEKLLCDMGEMQFCGSPRLYEA